VGTSYSDFEVSGSGWIMEWIVFHKSTVPFDKRFRQMMILERELHTLSIDQISTQSY